MIVVERPAYSSEELYLAYRKAKTYAYRDTNAPYGNAFAEYEADLANKLSKLKARLNGRGPLDDEDFLGTWTALPKALAMPGEDEDHYFNSDPLVWWKRHVVKTGKTPEFRPVIIPSVDFMVVSALWCMTVGDTLERGLDDECVLGNRLKRIGQADENLRKPLDRHSPNLFEYWPTAYSRWQQGGLSAMERELRCGHSIVAVTMDLQKFYHRIDPSFVLKPSFLDPNYFGEKSIVLDPQQRWLTRKLLRAIEAWRKQLEDVVGNEDLVGLGLPVGLSMSPVIANVALRQFDHDVKTELMPVYYGRYVDDVFLVLKPGRPFEDADAFVGWLKKRLSTVADTKDEGIKLNLDGLDGSNLVFGKAKQKIFALEGDEGLDLITPIREAMKRRSSEYRSMPRLPTAQAEMAGDALLTTSDAQIQGDALRKAEEVSLRRHGFALLLRKAEGYAELLDDSEWVERRLAFLRMARRYLATPRGFMDYAALWPRVVRLIVRTSQWDELLEWKAVLKRVKECVLPYGPCAKRAWNNQMRRLEEAIASASRQELPENVRDMFKSLLADGAPAVLKSLAFGLERADWLVEPFATKWLREAEPVATHPFQLSKFPKSLRAGLDEFCADIRREPDARLVIGTRKARPELISRVVLATNASRLKDAFRILRGVRLGVEPWRKEVDGVVTVAAPPEARGHKVRVVLPSIKTSMEAFNHAVRGGVYGKVSRFEAMTKLLDDAVADIVRWRSDSEGKGPRWPVYLVMPELSLPRRWSDLFIERLAQRNISLIAGLEYGFETLTPQSPPLNEALVALVSEHPAGGPIAHYQRKRHAAWGEDVLVHDAIGRHVARTDEALPIYAHGNFRFSVVICSDFSDIAQRAALRGKVDAVFVLEWNQDTESFSALVESAALDVHTFVVQVNNRSYGDSRIRAPYKEGFRRDVVRLKGGESDFYAIADIDFGELRTFQTATTPQQGEDALFKPFPIGFEVSKSRERPRNRVGYGSPTEAPTKPKT